MTIRQRKLAKNLGKAGSLKEAAIMSGYSPATARSQDSITKSKGWQQLLEKKLPDGELLTATKDALKANRKRAEVVDRDDKGRPVYEYFDEDDHQTRLKAAEQGYKLKGRFQPDVQVNTQNNYIGDDQLKRIIND